MLSSFEKGAWGPGQKHGPERLSVARKLDSANVKPGRGRRFFPEILESPVVDTLTSITWNGETSSTIPHPRLTDL